ncbi:MerC domain-containing protein [Leptolyngbya sp. 15MV]|nr:MerC domain-containing protein [Leptolyngbya sp. 15MV]
MIAFSNRQQYLDGAAVASSAACLVHCLVLPALAVLIPTMSAFLAVPESFHEWALALAMPTSAVALGAGFRRHRAMRPAMLALPGLTLLAAGAFMATTEQAETVLTVAGAVLLATGHALNWRAARHAL